MSQGPSAIATRLIKLIKLDATLFTPPSGKSVVTKRELMNKVFSLTKVEGNFRICAIHVSH